MTGDPQASPPSPTPHPITGKATAAAQEWHAVRALDDPAKLARAARIVRAALERKRLTIEDIMPGSDREAAAA